MNLPGTLNAVEPYGNNVLVTPAPKDEKIGSIFIPASAEAVPTKGTVVEVGPGRPQADGSYLQANVKPGDVVHYRQYAALPIKDTSLPGVDLAIINADEIIALQRRGPAVAGEAAADVNGVSSGNHLLTQEEAQRDFVEELARV